MSASARRPDEQKAPDPGRIARESRGRRAESIAAAYLMLTGHRILARRLKTPYGEIDLVAKRGGRIAFVEVKYRATTETAGLALSSKQAGRIARAAEHWLSRHAHLYALDRGYDAILIAPWRRPRLIRDALAPDVANGRRY